MSHFDYKQFYDRNLPHIQPPDATLFVTFRLDGSIPKSVLEQWLWEKKQFELRQLRREAVESVSFDSDVGVEERHVFHRRWFARFESLLHAEATGPVWLKEERIAVIVCEALRYRDGRVYRLDAFSIMPNHVHVVFAPSITEAAARKLAEDQILEKRKRRERTQTNSLRYSLRHGSRDGWSEEYAYCR